MKINNKKVLANVDELFRRPAFAAAPDVFPPDKFNAGVLVRCCVSSRVVE